MKSGVLGRAGGGNFVAKSKYIGRLFIALKPLEVIDILQDDAFRQKKKRVVISCADEITEVINQFSDELIDNYYLPGVQKQGGMLSLMNKLTMKKMGEEAGLKSPGIYKIDDEDIEFPVITKPAISSHGSKGEIKLFENSEELQKYISVVQDEVFVQQYVKKKEEVQFIGCSLRGGEEIIIPGMTRILRSQHNTNTGFLEYGPVDTFYQSTIESCKHFLRNCGYSGLFSMEFLRDINDKIYFLETNFRNDGNAWCVTASGVNLPLIWVLANKSLDYHKEAVKIPRNIVVMPEFQDFKLVLQRKVGLFQWLKDLMKTDAFLDYNKKDPKPFWCFIFEKLL